MSVSSCPKGGRKRNEDLNTLYIDCGEYLLDGIPAVLVDTSIFRLRCIVHCLSNLGVIAVCASLYVLYVPLNICHFNWISFKIIEISLRESLLFRC